MDVVFDIDGTLANASHRLHHIKDTRFFIPSALGLRDLKPNWEKFLSPEMVMKDTAITTVWAVLEAMHIQDHRILFITGRNLTTYSDTYNWLKQMARLNAPQWYFDAKINLFMRDKDDRSPSEVSKRKSLHRARELDFDPKLVFEDRATDTAMWRDEGLICCQVAEGKY